MQTRWISRSVVRNLTLTSGPSKYAADSPLLRTYLKERGILAPGSSHAKLVRHAQSDCDALVAQVTSEFNKAKSEVLSRVSVAFDTAQRYKNTAESAATKAYAEMLSSAGKVADQATTAAQDGASHLRNTGESVWESLNAQVMPLVNSLWDTLRLTFAEQQPLRFQKEKFASYSAVASSASSSAAKEASAAVKSATSAYGDAVRRASAAAHAEL